MNFDELINSAIAPIGLISGIGLLLLSLVNRYHHCLDRTRSLLALKHDRELSEQQNWSLHLLYRRCHRLRTSIVSISCSVCFSGSIVMLSVIETVLGFQWWHVKAGLLFMAILWLNVSAVLFAYDLLQSMKSLQAEYEEEMNRHPTG